MKRKLSLLASAAVLLAGIVSAVVVLVSGKHTTAVAQDATTNTAPVERGNLSSLVSMTGTLTYRARADGSPYAVINHASGTFTALPDVGTAIACGDVLYRVDSNPVLLLCGAVPAYRDLHQGDAGDDVRQLNRNLRVGANDTFTAATASALAALQRAKGLAPTGELHLADAVFLPEPARVAKLAVAPGAAAQPGAAVLDATSETLEVRVDLPPSQQSQIQPGNRARITLPSNRSVTGKVDRLGSVAEVAAGSDGKGADATIPAYVSLDEPVDAGGLDQAPVQVDVTTAGVQDALSVPVTAVVGRSGGGFGVEVVRADGRRALVAVELGLFDTTAGRVQVTGAVREGDRVVVPSL